MQSIQKPPSPRKPYRKRNRCNIHIVNKYGFAYDLRRPSQAAELLALEELEDAGHIVEAFELACDQQDRS